jgi:CRP/FNR family transcriptional regulator, cyclic AMP receptor protein
MIRVGETRSDHSRILAQVQIFSGLTQAELNSLAECVTPRHYSPGEVIFCEGDACAGLYVVERGHVRVFKTSHSGREQVLTIDSPGNSVAEIPVFDGGVYPASGAAVDHATLLFISKQDFQSLCLAYPQVALKVLRVVGARLRRLVGIIEELSFTIVRHRIISLLLRLAVREGRKTNGGVEWGITLAHARFYQQLRPVGVRSTADLQ